MSVKHHDKTVAVLDCIGHIMCDHESCKVITLNKVLCKFKNLMCCLWVKGCCVLVAAYDGKTRLIDNVLI